MADLVVLFVTDPSVLRGELCGHTDSVWGLVYSSAHQRLLSCSADGTVRLWDANSTSPALAVFNENKSIYLTSLYYNFSVFYVSLKTLNFCVCLSHQSWEFPPLLTWCAVNQLTWSHPSPVGRLASSTWRPAS